MKIKFPIFLIKRCFMVYNEGVKSVMLNRFTLNLSENNIMRIYTWMHNDYTVSQEELLMIIK